MELENLLEKLKLEHLEAQLDAVCEQAAQRNSTTRVSCPSPADRMAGALPAWYRGASANWRVFPGSRHWTSLTSTSSPVWIASRCVNWRA